VTDLIAEQGQPGNPLNQTREQVYAGKAYADVVAFRDAHKSQEDRDAYKSMVQSLPVLVRTAGLAQALAFVNTRDGQRRAILEHLTALLRNDLGGESLLDRSRAANLGEYLYLTRQVMSALLWYKRYAEWLLDKERAGQTSQQPAAGEGLVAGAEVRS
jgi:CRISPR-associated protein Cmr5